MMSEGRPDDLVKDPKRSFSSFISAATMLDIVNEAPRNFKDFWGTQTGTKDPGLARIRCPLLAFFGTRGDVGGEAELELAVCRQAFAGLRGRKSSQGSGLATAAGQSRLRATACS
jgi:hypothetical protein